MVISVETYLQTFSLADTHRCGHRSFIRTKERTVTSFTKLSVPLLSENVYKNCEYQPRFVVFYVEQYLNIHFKGKPQISMNLINGEICIVQSYNYKPYRFNQ